MATTGQTDQPSTAGGVLDNLSKDINKSQIIISQITTLIAAITALLATLLPNRPTFIGPIAFLIAAVILVVIFRNNLGQLLAKGRKSQTHPSLQGSKARLVITLLVIGISLISGIIMGIAGWALLTTTGYWMSIDLAPCITGNKSAITSLVFSNTNSSEIFVSSDNGGLCKSNDDGLTWESITPPSGTNPIFTAFGLHPDGSVFGASATGDFYKLNGNLTLLGLWAPAGERHYPTKVVVDPINTQILYVSDVATNSLYQSQDTGKTWNAIIVPASGSAKVNTFTLISDIIFVGTNDGHIFYSSDQGKTWQNIPVENLPSAQINALIGDPENSAILYAATLQGFFQIKLPSVGIIMTGEAYPLTPDLQGVPGKFLAFDPKNANTLYANLVNGKIYIVNKARQHTILITDRAEVEQHNLLALTGVADQVYALYAPTDNGLFAWQPSSILSIILAVR